MSRIALQHTRDPEIRRMAEQTIKEQERSIEELQSLLRKHGG